VAVPPSGCQPNQRNRSTEGACLRRGTSGGHGVAIDVVCRASADHRVAVDAYAGGVGHIAALGEPIRGTARQARCGGRHLGALHDLRLRSTGQAAEHLDVADPWVARDQEVNRELHLPARADRAEIPVSVGVRVRPPEVTAEDLHQHNRIGRRTAIQNLELRNVVPVAVTQWPVGPQPEPEANPVAVARQEVARRAESAGADGLITASRECLAEFGTLAAVAERIALADVELVRAAVGEYAATIDDS
jgi:hypothetical protein